jgi:hypothetical protein
VRSLDERLPSGDIMWPRSTSSFFLEARLLGVLDRERGVGAGAAAFLVDLGVVGSTLALGAALALGVVASALALGAAFGSRAGEVGFAAVRRRDGLKSMTTDANRCVKTYSHTALCSLS